MVFDRLLYIDRLKDAGVDERLARAHAEALRDALLETVATKADLHELAAITKADFKDHVFSIQAELQQFRDKTNAAFERLASKTSADIEKLLTRPLLI